MYDHFWERKLRVAIERNTTGVKRLGRFKTTLNEEVAMTLLPTYLQIKDSEMVSTSILHYFQYKGSENLDDWRKLWLSSNWYYTWHDFGRTIGIEILIINS